MDELNEPIFTKIQKETKDKLTGFCKNTGVMKKRIVDLAINEYIDSRVIK